MTIRIAFPGIAFCALTAVTQCLFNPNAYAEPGIQTNDGAIEEIIVTARRSEEDLRDVPFTVNTIDSERIRLDRLRSLEELFLAVPGVEITSFNDSSGANVRIRGVGAINKTSRDDSSVVIYIDGVPQPIGVSTLGTLDMESVEVLKGPQGTLFGRNSEAGAIQITTHQAVFENEGYVRAEYGEDDRAIL